MNDSRLIETVIPPWNAVQKIVPSVVEWWYRRETPDLHVAVYGRDQTVVVNVLAALFPDLRVEIYRQEGPFGQIRFSTRSREAIQ